MLQLTESVSYALVAVVALLAAAACLARLELQRRKYSLMLIAIGLELFRYYGMSSVIVLVVRNFPNWVRFQTRAPSAPDWGWVLLVFPGYLAHAAAWAILFYVGLKMPRERRSRYLVEPLSAHN